ncbi:MAG: DUF2306 domain-containing protein [Rhodoglobus sp.]|nr:DUF2306 domain-containing protein [Rhodoglobus sp.]
MTTTAPARPPVQPSTTRPRRLASRIGWGWLVLSAATVVIMVLAPYLTTSLRDLADADTSIAATYVDQPVPILIAFYAHIAFGAVALLIGPLQFARGLRERFPRAHRALGSTSVVAIIIASLAGLVISPLTSAGLIGTVGFGILAVLWASFALLGLRAILRRDLRGHRAWMTRTFALTYAAVTLRLWIPILMMVFIATGTDPDEAFAAAYVIVPFLSWVPNLIFAEWLNRYRARATR